MGKAFGKIVGLVVIFFTAQVVAVLACGAICGMSLEKLATSMMSLDPSLFAGCWLVADLLFIALLWQLKWAGRGLKINDKKVSKTSMKWAIFAQILMMVASISLLVKFDLDTGGMEEFLEHFMTSPLAILMLVVVGPLMEEVIFRDGILRILRQDMHVQPWLAVLLSALCFGVAHGNMAQFVNATGMAVVLGLMYLKTNDLSLCLPAHIINNGLSVLVEYLVPDEKIMTLPTGLLVSVGVLALSGVVVVMARKILPIK